MDKKTITAAVAATVMLMFVAAMITAIKINDDNNKAIVGLVSRGAHPIDALCAIVSPTDRLKQSVCIVRAGRSNP